MEKPVLPLALLIHGSPGLTAGFQHLLSSLLTIMLTTAVAASDSKTRTEKLWLLIRCWQGGGGGEPSSASPLSLYPFRLPPVPGPGPLLLIMTDKGSQFLFGCYREASLKYLEIRK